MTRLGAVVNEFVALMQWSDVVDDDEQNGASRLGARMEVDGQSCQMFVETDEAQC